MNQIANHGFNICLLDNDTESLTNIETKLQKTFPQIKTMSINLSEDKSISRKKMLNEVGRQLSMIGFNQDGSVNGESISMLVLAK